MNCNGVIREISNYIDGDLDAAMKHELEGHLHHCEDCAMVVNQTKMTVEVFCDSQPSLAGAQHAAPLPGQRRIGLPALRDAS